MVISIRDLGVTFPGGKKALDGLSVEIGSGVCGLLGPNASGKTTLIRILATLLEQTSGTVMIDGRDLSKHRGDVRATIGYLPQKFHTFTHLTAAEFLEYSARLAGIRSAAERSSEVNRLLETLGLAKVRNQNANDLTPAQKRHLEIAQAVIGNPRMILMDEPTTGLSPEERIRFNALLADQISRAENIIFTTHIMGDITSTCSQAIVLVQGKAVYSGPPENAAAHLPGTTAATAAVPPKAAVAQG